MRCIAATFAFLASLPIVSASPAAVAAPPNVILILADDLGYGDLSCYGNDQFATPQLDRLAEQGLRFIDFHSNGCVCSPTRAALLTGRYPQRAGIPGVIYADPNRNRHHGLHTDELTIADLLQNAGYRTALVGKWHLGYDIAFNPTRNGFDVFRGYVSGNVDYHSHIDGAGIFDWWDGLRQRDEPGYSTHLITRSALRFIEENRDRPFFLYIAHEAPHSPFQGPNDPPVRGPQAQRPRRDIGNAYREMISEMDAGIGEVIDTLDRFGLSDRTLVFFLSDNGATREGSNGPLRGQKGTLWEGGHRIPAIARWPGRIEPGITDATACGFDLFPTIARLVGVAPPEEHLLDGVDLGPVLFHAGVVAERTLFWYHGEQRAARRGRWKYVENLPGQRDAALFDLDADLAEQHDLSAQHLHTLRELRTAFEAWVNDVSEQARPQPQRPRS